MLLENKLIPLPFLCEAFSVNKNIYNGIDVIYNKNKFKYYESAKNNEFYNHPIASIGSLKQEEYFKKALGILLNQENIKKELSDLLYIGWHYTITYVKNHNKIDSTHYMIRLLKKNNLTNDELNSNMIIFLYAAENEKKEIESNKELQDFISALFIRLKFYKDTQARISLNAATERHRLQIRKLKTELYEKHGQFNNLWDMFKKDETLKDYIDCISLNYDFECLSLISISNEIEIDEKTIDEILLAYVDIYGTTNSSDAIKYLIAMIQIRILTKAYINIKKYHFENSSDTMLFKINELESKLNLEADNIKILENKIKNLENEKLKLERENKRISEDLNEAYYNKAELLSLRTYMFSQDNKITELENIYDFNPLKNIKALMIGGTTTTYENIKANFNKLIYIGPNNLNFDKNLIHDIDVILIFVNCLSHALYYKIMNNNINKKIIYVNNQNKDIILKEIVQNLN